MTTAAGIIQAAYREGNIVAAGKSPTTNEQTEALGSLQRIVDGIMGFEMGELLEDWLVPNPQRTAPVAARWPQGPFSSASDPAPFAAPGPTTSPNVWPYPPTQRRIVFGSVSQTVYFPESPVDGSRMAIVQGSGLGDNGVPGTASDVLTYTGLPVAGTTVTVNGQAYTWRAAVALANEVLIGPSIAGSLVNMAAAINGGAQSGVAYGPGTVANTGVTASCSLATLTATAIQSGTGGNAIAAATTSGNGSWATATLTGGTAGAILTLDGNGRYIDRASQQAFQTPIPPLVWVYRADLGQWVRAASLTLTDNMPFPPQFDDFFICVLNKRTAPRYNKVVSNETQLTAQTVLMNFRAYYRQSQVTTYGSENMPRTDQSYLGGSWWW